MGKSKFEYNFSVSFDDAHRIKFGKFEYNYKDKSRYIFPKILDPVPHFSFHGSGISQLTVDKPHIHSKFSLQEFLKDVENTKQHFQKSRVPYQAVPGDIIIMKVQSLIATKLGTMRSISSKNGLHIPMEDLNAHLLVKYDSKNILKDINSLKKDKIIEPNDIIFTIDDEKCSVGDNTTSLIIKPDDKSIHEFIPGARTFTNVFSELNEKKVKFSSNPSFINSLNYLTKDFYSKIKQT